ncbi:hypothetical protein M514_09394 [Trichuris suis]|uniref:Uncharacterized protein n=1 Tax=Trichuris suis TaxID=68888 RepID=A0A085MXU8_9BILA|nr:hypothetical protein M513_09394 [Trichuris suis]KFD62044.1 hypothetical protein M514_09394 [Trichuris suis]
MNKCIIPMETGAEITRDRNAEEFKLSRPICKFELNPASEAMDLNEVFLGEKTKLLDFPLPIVPYTLKPNHCKGSVFFSSRVFMDLFPSEGAVNMRKNWENLFSSKRNIKTTLLAKLSALSASRHQRKQVFVVSQVRLLEEAPMPVQLVWHPSGRNFDPSRLHAHGWIGFVATTLEAVLSGGATYNQTESHIQWRVKGIVRIIENSDIRYLKPCVFAVATQPDVNVSLVAFVRYRKVFVPEIAAPAPQIPPFRYHKATIFQCHFLVKTDDKINTAILRQQRATEKFLPVQELQSCNYSLIHRLYQGCNIRWYQPDRETGGMYVDIAFFSDLMRRSLWRCIIECHFKKFVLNADTLFRGKLRNKKAKRELHKHDYAWPVDRYRSARSPIPDPGKQRGAVLLRAWSAPPWEELHLQEPNPVSAGRQPS